MPARYFLYIFLVAGPLATNAQNLVMNPGFEETPECPLTSRFDFYYKGPALNWTSPNSSTPDLYHKKCAFSGSATTTNLAEPAQGEGFSGMYVYGSFGNGNSKIYNREYIFGMLSQPLEKGQVYEVSYYVRPVNADRAGISAGIADIGMFLSGSRPTPNHELRMDVSPQIAGHARPVINNTEWTQIKGCFTATGGEQFITLGNFKTDEETMMEPLPGSVNTAHGYFLIDEISVVPIMNGDMLKDNYSICAHDSLSLLAETGNMIPVTWENGTTENPRVIEKPGTYRVQAIPFSGCVIRDSTNVEVNNCEACQFHVPDAFTPDGNFINETLHLQSNCELKWVLLEVFNRWGELIYREKSQSPAWDGKFGGDLVQEGVYLYSFSVFYVAEGAMHRKNINGNVSLLR